MILARQQNVILLLLLQKSGHGAMFPKEEVLELVTTRIVLRWADAALGDHHWPRDTTATHGSPMAHHSLGPHFLASEMTQPGHFWIDDLEVIAMVFGIASLAGDGDAKLVLVHFVLSASLFSLFVVGFMC